MWAEAASGHERAGDVAAAAKLHLHRLSNANKAFALVRQTRDAAAARALAQWCVQQEQWGGAVEFHALSGDVPAAVQVAETHGQMDALAACLPTDASSALRGKLAVWYQNAGQHSKAAAQFEAAGKWGPCVAQLLAHAQQVRALCCDCSLFGVVRSQVKAVVTSMQHCVVGA